MDLEAIVFSGQGLGFFPRPMLDCKSAVRAHQPDGRYPRTRSCPTYAVGGFFGNQRHLSRHGIRRHAERRLCRLHSRLDNDSQKFAIESGTLLLACIKELGIAKNASALVFPSARRHEGQNYDPAQLPPRTSTATAWDQYRQDIKLQGLTIPASVDDGLDLEICTIPDPSHLATIAHSLDVVS